MAATREEVVSTACKLLESRVAEPGELCKAIVQLGKPYDRRVIEEHAELIATYLCHSDHVVRHEAIWFLGSWGHLPRYAPFIVNAALSDADVYNRAYAARSLGSFLRHEKDRELTERLLNLVDDADEEMEVRLSAYSGLLYAWNRPDDFAVAISDRPLSSIDRGFIAQLHAWVHHEDDIPTITPSRGVWSSLWHAWRAGQLTFADITKVRMRKT